MAYTVENFATKEALKAAVAAGEVENLRTYNPSGMFPVTQDGRDVIEGPQYSKPHRWYAGVIVKGGVVVKVTG